MDSKFASQFSEEETYVSQDAQVVEQDELKFIKPESSYEAVSGEPNKGIFRIKPLDRGYGLTIGNALRRVLLASLPGAAIINIQIDGVQHEFSSIDGVIEDVTSIILNLKGVVLKYVTDTMDIKNMLIDVEGPCTVTAADITCDDEVEVVNKDQYICRVTSGHLHIQLQCKRGVGYQNGDENRKYTERIAGYIPIDSIYTPVVNVAYKVNKVRVEDNPNYEELVMEITTNGGITPDAAIAQAAKILSDHLSCVINLSEAAKETETMIEKKKEEVEVKTDRPVEDLPNLSLRSYNCLKRAGIQTIGELTEKTEEDMIKIRNLGKKSLKEIKDRLTEMGLGFKHN